MATKYGYMIYTFKVHRHGSVESPEELGHFDGEHDALVSLYGALRGLATRRVSDSKNRHIRAKGVKGIGRTVRFAVDVGQSGQSSEFYDPDDDEKPVFERQDQHIETNARRGLVVAPSRATTGLLIMEAHGRSTAKSLLAPQLARIFRYHSEGYILSIASVVDEAALKKFIAEARAHEITLRRTGLPSDIADAVELSRDEASVGKMELRIVPGKIRWFQQTLISKLRGDNSTRRKLLQLHGLEFDELSVGMTVGDRRTTLTVTADHVPTFIYDIRTRGVPDDERFYNEVLATVREIGPAVGVSVTPGWDDSAWSDEAQDAILTLPPEGPDHESTQDQPQ